MSRVGLRPATHADVEFLFGALRAALGSYVETSGGPWDDAFQRDLFVRGLDFVTHRVIEVDGRPAGRPRSSRPVRRKAAPARPRRRRAFASLRRHRATPEGVP